MNTVFIVTETQVNDYLPEYPKGAQTSIVGTSNTLEDAKELVKDAIEYTFENYDDSQVDVDMSDDMETVVWAYGLDDKSAVFIFKIHEQPI